jgi:hypothetical protein
MTRSLASLFAVACCAALALPAFGQDSAQQPRSTPAESTSDFSGIPEATDTAGPAVAATPAGEAPTGMSRLERRRLPACREEAQKKGLSGDELQRDVRECVRRTHD